MESKFNLNSNLEGFIFNSLFDILDESNGYREKKKRTKPLENLLTIRGEYINRGVVVEENTIHLYADKDDPFILWVQKFDHFFPMPFRFFHLVMDVVEEWKERVS